MILPTIVRTVDKRPETRRIPEARKITIIIFKYLSPVVVYVDGQNILLNCSWKL